MKVIEWQPPCKKAELYLVGDTHYPRGRREKFVKVLDEIKRKPNAYMLGLGDWVEAISQNDKRYNPEEMAEVVEKYGHAMNMIDEQWGMFEDDIRPIAEKGKIIGLHGGNHGASWKRRNSYNELKKICRRLDVEFLTDGMAVTNIKGSDGNTLMLSFHGCGGGTTTGSTYNKLENYGSIVSNVDLIAAGHTHKLGINVSAARLKLLDGELKDKVQYHVATGSFLGNYEKGVASYSERKAYTPLPMGYIKVVFVNGVIPKDGVSAIAV